MFDVEKTKNYLLKVCIKTKKLDTESFKSPRKFWFRKGISVFLEDTAVIEFNKAMDELCRDDFIKNNFPQKFIETKLEEIISSAFKLSEQDRSDFIKKELDSLKSYIKKEIKKWIFIIPVENLSIKRQFTVGNVTFYNFTKNRGKNIKKLCLGIIKNNKNYNKEQKKKFVEDQQTYFINSLSGLTCAEIMVEGVLENAQQIALQKVRLALSILKLYSYYNDDSYKRYFGIVGEVIKHSNRVIIRYPMDKKSINPVHQKVGYLFKYELDKNRIKFMRKNGFDKLNKMLKKSELGDFESRLLTSIYWFGEAINLYISRDKRNIDEKRTEKHDNLEYFKSGERYLKLFTAIECILIFNDGEPITNNISERSALILAKKYEDRKKIKKDVKELYYTRSKIVHHGEVFVSKYDLEYLTNLVQVVIITLIKIKDKVSINTHQDLYEYLEKIKLS